MVKLLWLAIINIEDKSTRERAARRAQTGKRSDQPARLVEASVSWAGARPSTSWTSPIQAG